MIKENEIHPLVQLTGRVQNDLKQAKEAPGNSSVPSGFRESVQIGWLIQGKKGLEEILEEVNSFLERENEKTTTN